LTDFLQQALCSAKLVVHKSPNFDVRTCVHADFKSSMNYCVQTI